MARKSKSKHGSERKAPPRPPFQPPTGAATRPTGVTARPTGKSTRPEPRPPTADEIADVLAARRRVADAYHAAMIATIAPMPGQKTVDLMDRIAPQDLRHLAWVIAHDPTKQHREFIGDDAFCHRMYRRDYALYGGARPYLDLKQRGPIEMEYGLQLMPRAFQTTDIDLSDFPLLIRKRLQAVMAKSSEAEYLRLSDLLLKDLWLVSDILPLDPPPKPPSWAAPAAGTYVLPAADLLERGPDLGTGWAESAARNPAWAVSENRQALVRMATDPGLLRGWPADAATWAPYHALTLLGVLRARETAPLLLDLIDSVEGDDWITDHLFGACLSVMGPPVEPVLWTVAHDRRRDPAVRGPALLALAGIAGRHPARTDAIAEALAGFMQQKPLLDRKRKTVNGIVAMVLSREPFDQQWVHAVIWKADAARMLDHRCFNPAEMEAFELDGFGAG